MFQVKFVPSNICVSVEAGKTLMEAAQSANIFLDVPCNGHGTCGKCKLRLIQGSVDMQKNYHLTDAETRKGFILACSSKIKENITVEVPSSRAESLNHMKIEGLTATKDEAVFAKTMELIRKKGLLSGSCVRKDYLELDVPTLDNSLPDWERVQSHLQKTKGYTRVFCGLSILRKIPRLLRDSSFRITITHLPEGTDKTTVINVEGENTTSKLYGVAIDVGTTSIAAFLVDLPNGNIIAKASAGNAQIKHGADIINRIVYATKGDGLRELNRAIIQETLNPLLRKLCLEAQIEKDEVCAFVAAGNTTMMHLLLGVYPDFLRREPYIPAFVTSPEMKARELGMEINSETPVYILPSVSSYVGGDITGGVLSSGLWSSDEKVLLLDLGTNGEIVLGNKDFMLTCACSAGPAFEGGEISCGMRASEGAIEKVKINRFDFEPELKTILNKKPQGICGSGIIDTVAELFKAGLIDSKGRISRKINSKRIRFDEYQIGEYVLAFAEESGIEKDITITDIDLDNFIRAKGAVYSAVSTLLNSIGMDFVEIDRILVAGGIGTNIDILNSITIGLFPDIPLDKYEYIGNSSLMGSYLTLISQDARKKAEEIASNMTYVELSTHPSYMNEFVSACFLPHTDVNRFPKVMEKFLKER
ncbi:MAG: DUF4445 domain-containing protein [Peptococcaceae bacterium]|nr:DUF4445 domain-containing protein [Peptococcaceae bacterium]